MHWWIWIRGDPSQIFLIFTEFSGKLSTPSRLSTSDKFWSCHFVGVLWVITARKRGCGKVMFLHLCVILLTGGGWLPSMHHRLHDQHWWGCNGGLPTEGSASRQLGRPPPSPAGSGWHASYWNAVLFRQLYYILI